MTLDNNIQLKDETIYPDEKVLKSVLGNSFDTYLELLDLFNKNELTHEWRYYKDGKAWLCKVQKKKKTIVWMSIWKGYIQSAIYFPVRLLENILELDINQNLKDNFLETKNVGKSKPCIFNIYDRKILDDFEKVMLLKIKSK